MSWKDHKGPCGLLGNSGFCKVSETLEIGFLGGSYIIEFKVTSLDHSGYCVENRMVEEHHQLIAAVQTRDDGES